MLYYENDEILYDKTFIHSNEQYKLTNKNENKNKFINSNHNYFLDEDFQLHYLCKIFINMNGFKD